MTRNFRGIFVEADSPEFLEKLVEPTQEVMDLNTLDVRGLLDDYKTRQANYDTAPFDPDGHHLRFFPCGFTIWSGFPGTGKTTLLRQLACHLMRAGKMVFIASLEENPMDVFYRLACVALGTENPTEDGLQWCVDCWNDKLRLWSYRRGIAAHARLLALIRVLAKQGVTHSIIDSLARLDVNSGDWEAQRLFGNSLEATAAASNSHIHLVAHPRKLIDSNQAISVNDVAGSADIGRLADNAIFVQRKDTDAPDEFSPMRICVRKQRYFTGACATIEGYFNRRLRQFKPHIHDCEVTRYLPGGAYGEVAYVGADR